MSFDWLKNHHKTNKPPGYAEKTLAAYALGIRAGGSIRGVRIQISENCCQAAKNLPERAVYQPQHAPKVPLSECTLGEACTCVYRPVMTYELAEFESGDPEL